MGAHEVPVLKGASDLHIALQLLAGGDTVLRTAPAEHSAHHHLRSGTGDGAHVDDAGIHSRRILRCQDVREHVQILRIKHTADLTEDCARFFECVKTYRKCFLFVYFL